MTDRHRLYAGAAIGLVAAATLGFGAARLTQSSTSPSVAKPVEASPLAPLDSVAMTPQAITTSQITIAPADTGDIAAAILASATIEAMPDAEAVLTARAPGTVTRILSHIGDPVRAGQTLALVESRDASQITADREAASARVTLAARQLARERTLLDQGVSAHADFESAQASLAVARADARRASAAAGAARVSGDGRYVAVVSQVAGRVTRASAHPGQFVAAETELFRVADPRRLQIVASVPPADAARIRAGDRVTLTTSDGRTIEGRVRASTGVVDPQSRAATIVVTPIAAAGILSPGQLVQARIFATAGAARNGIVVPQEAVQILGQQSVVFVRTATGFKARPVRIDSRSGGMAAIAGGLAAGTPIATVNAFLLKAELEKNAGGEE